MNLRRGRLYFVAKYDDWRVNVTPDFGDTPDGTPTLFEANINYTGIKPVTFTVGYTHPFVSLEDATFPGNLLFLERPSIIIIERSVAAGIQRSALGGYAATEDYFASAYLTGPIFGAQKDTLLNNEQLAFVGRVAVRPYHDQDWNLHAEASGQHVFHPNLNTSGVPGVSQQHNLVWPMSRSSGLLLTSSSTRARYPQAAPMFTAAASGPIGATT